MSVSTVLLNSRVSNPSSHFRIWGLPVCHSFPPSRVQGLPRNAIYHLLSGFGVCHSSSPCKGSGFATHHLSTYHVLQRSSVRFFHPSFFGSNPSPISLLGFGSIILFEGLRLAISGCSFSHPFSFKVAVRRVLDFARLLSVFPIRHLSRTWISSFMLRHAGRIQRFGPRPDTGIPRPAPTTETCTILFLQ